MNHITINSLPEEALLHCFSFLPPSALVKAGIVNSRWYSISQEPILWKNICIQKFKEMATPTEGWKEYFKTKVICPNNIRNADFTPKLTRIEFSSDEVYNVDSQVFIVNGILIVVNSMCSKLFLKNLVNGQERYADGKILLDPFEIKQNNNKLFIHFKNQVFVIDCSKEKLEDIKIDTLWKSQNESIGLAFDVDDDTLVLTTNKSLEIVDIHSKEVKTIDWTFDSPTSVSLSKNYITVESKLCSLFDRISGDLIALSEPNSINFVKNNDTYFYEGKNLREFNSKDQNNLIYESKYLVDEAHQIQDGFLFIRDNGAMSDLTFFNTKNREAKEISLTVTVSIKVYDHFIVSIHTLRKGVKFYDINTGETVLQLKGKCYQCFDGRFLISKEENCLEIRDFLKKDESMV